MRILHLLSSPAFSGPAENILLLASAQRTLGHQVTVAVDRTRLPTSEEAATPVFDSAGLLDESGLHLSVKSGPRQWLSDIRRLSLSPAEVLHCHFSHDHLLCRIGRNPQALLVRSIHAPRSLRWSTPSANAFTVPFPALLPRLRVAGVVLPALVDERFRPSKDRESLRASLGLSGSPLIGVVSAFQPSRRHDVAIEAFALLVRSHPAARLALVGDGTLEPTLRATVSRAGLTGSISFLGYRRGAEYLRVLQSLDQVWILGLGNDFSARAAAQARASGVRVLAVDQGALSQHADALVPLSAPEIALAASDLRPLGKPHPANLDVARGILALYEGLR